jgi:hypothetical protein
MSDGGEQEPAVAAAEEYIMGGAGNLLIDVDEDEDAELLPVLNSIWECPKIIKCSGFDIMERHLLGGPVAGAP